MVKPIVQMRPDRCRYCDILYAALKYPLDEAKLRRYDVTDLGGDLATKEELEATIAGKTPVFFHGGGHGDEKTFTGQDMEPVLQVGVNEEVCAGMIVYLLSCLTGVELGPAIVKAGGWAYIGYTDVWGWVDEDGAGDPYSDKYARGFYEGSNAIVISFLDGLTAEEAEKTGCDKYNEWVDYWTSSDDPNASECIHWLTHDRDNCVQLGDPTAKLDVVGYTLTVNSYPLSDVEFQLDGVNSFTPSTRKLPAETAYTITMPSRVTTADNLVYDFVKWEDGSTDPTRTVTLTGNMEVTAFYEQVSMYALSVDSEPFTGVSFDADDLSGYITPCILKKLEGTHTIVFPAEVEYNGEIFTFKQWEDGSTDPTRTINLTEPTEIIGYYVKPHNLTLESSPVTGVPVNVDDRSVGATPITALVPEGSHTVSVPEEVEV